MDFIRSQGVMILPVSESAVSNNGKVGNKVILPTPGASGLILM